MIKDFLKKNSLIVVILGILFGTLIVDSCDDKIYRKEVKQQIQELKDDRDQELQKKILENEILQAKNGQLEGQLTQINGKIVILEQERAEDKDRIKDLELKAQESAPESLVEDMKGILGTNEIWLTTEGVVLSVDAFRKVSSKLYDWEDFTLVREPRYLEELAQYKISVFVLEEQKVLLYKQIETKQDMINIQTNFEGQFEDLINKKLKSDFWGSVKQVGTGIAIGGLLVLIVK